MRDTPVLLDALLVPCAVTEGLHSNLNENTLVMPDALLVMMPDASSDALIPGCDCSADIQGSNENALMMPDALISCTVCALWGICGADIQVFNETRADDA
jgi:hypothetical protein